MANIEPRDLSLDPDSSKQSGKQEGTDDQEEFPRFSRTLTTRVYGVDHAGVSVVKHRRSLSSPVARILCPPPLPRHWRLSDGGSTAPLELGYLRLENYQSKKSGEESMCLELYR